MTVVTPSYSSPITVILDQTGPQGPQGPSGIISPISVFSMPVSASVPASPCNAIYSNLGATGAVVAQLPATGVGINNSFRVAVAQQFSMQAAAGSFITYNGQSSSSGGSIYSSQVGALIELAAVSATEWAVIKLIGTWDLL